MLHPSCDALAFETPFDVMIAIGVCNALSSDATYHLAQLSGYAGYFVDRGSMESTLNVTLATPTANDLTMLVFDFSEGRHAQTVHHFEAGSTVNLTLTAPESHFAFEQVVVVALFLLFAAAASAWRPRIEIGMRSKSQLRPCKPNTSKGVC